jgi:hemolysin III
MYYGEKLNAWTHLAGAALALAGALWLLISAIDSNDPWKIVSVIVYGSTLVLLYAISTIYHSTPGRLKRTMRKLDHLSIYFLIAGSYTPFCLITLRGAWGWSLFGVVWSLAAIGILLEVFQKPGPRILSVILYAVMGWAVLAAINPLLENLGPAGFFWLAGGGVLYTLGIVFFAFDKRFRYWHGIWHLFVLAGSAFHFIAIRLYVI